MRALLARFLLLVSLLSLSALVQAQSGSLVGGQSPFGQSASSLKFLPVEEAYRVELEVQPDHSLRIFWVIADSYYLYQHRFSFTLTAPTVCTVTGYTEHWGLDALNPGSKSVRADWGKFFLGFGMGSKASGKSKA
mgnify:CR=1 FL=1